MFKKFKHAELKNEIKYLKGIGQGEVVTIGFADKTNITVTFHVVKQRELEFSAIIGNDVLSQVDILFSTNGVIFIEGESDVDTI